MSNSTPLPKKGNIWRGITTALLTAAIVAAVCWGVYTYFHLDKRLYTNDAQVEEYINPVNTRITGYLKEVRFGDHQRCRKGDTLVIIDDREFHIAVEQTQAAWLSAKASKQVTSTAVATVHSNVKITDANIRSLDARIWNARQNMERFENLLREEAATQQQYDQMKTEYVALAEQKEALIRQRTTTGLSTEEATRRIYVNEAEIMRAKAAMDLAELNFSYTVITAPYDGVTGRRNIQEGQAVTAGQTLLSFIRSDSKWIVANYEETQVTRLHIGQKMLITADGIPGRRFEGRIAAISEATGSLYSAIPVDNSTGNFVKVRQRIPVRIEFTGNNNSQEIEKLIAGMNVEVQIGEK